MLEIKRHPTDPKLYRLTSELRLPVPRDRVFAFFADAFNLQKLTPPWLHFTVLTEPPIKLRTGARIDYRLRLRGLPIRWQSEITAWNPSYRFVDEQIRGPYRSWRHEHTFVADGDETIVRDQVDYAVPGGALIHWLLVKTDVKRIFEYRSEFLRRRFAERSSVLVAAS